MIERKLRSACFECEPEERDYDSPKCQNCDKRLKRLKEIAMNVGDDPEEIKEHSDKIQKVIKLACENSGVDYKRELMALERDHKTTSVRKAIIVQLKATLRVKQADIARYLGVTPQYVHTVLREQGASNDHNFSNSSVIGGHQVVTLDFTNDPDLYGKLEDLADVENRSVALQAFHILYQYFED